MAGGKIIGQGEKPSYPLPVLDWGRNQGKAGTCAIEVKMAAGGGAGPKRPISLAWERMDWLGGGGDGLSQNMEVWEVSFPF